jgi:lysine-specific permease
MTSLAGFLSWITIAIAHYRFRVGYVTQNRKIEDLKYYARLFPVGTIVVVVSCVFFIICQNFDSFRNRDWLAISLTYFTVVLFIVMGIVYKIVKKTTLVPYETMFSVDRTPPDYAPFE